MLNSLLKNSYIKPLSSPPYNPPLFQLSLPVLTAVQLQYFLLRKELIKSLLMVCYQFTSLLLLWLLLSSLALRDSIGSEQHESATVSVDIETNPWAKGFDVEAKYRSVLRKKGRRMGAIWKGEEEEKSRVKNTGNAKQSENKQLWPSSNNRENIKFHTKSEASGHKPAKYFSFPHSGGRFGSKETVSVSHRATDQFQKIKTEKHRDVVAEVYNMMAKDYHTKAKSKPPINNEQPFDEEP